MNNLLSIGRFSQTCRLTVKTLRHYDEVGLLKPAMVDPDTGFRYYSQAQVGEAEHIRLLRSLDMPLGDIAAILGEREPALVRRRLESYRREVEGKIAGCHGVLAVLDRLLDPTGKIPPYRVTVMDLAAQETVSLRLRADMADMGRVAGSAFNDLFAHLRRNGTRPAGPPLAVYHDGEYKEEDAEVSFCLPVAEPLPGRGIVRSERLPPGPGVTTMHPGAYSDMGGAYRALTAWMQAGGHCPAGPPREVYLVGPDRAGDPKDYRTQVIWPVI